MSAVLDPTTTDRSPMGGQIRLTETPNGWTLQIDLAPDLAAMISEQLADGGGQAVTLTDFAISIRPNLVPGEPFAISSMELTVRSP